MNLPSIKAVHNMKWEKFLPYIKKALNENKVIELSMFKNYWIRFILLHKDKLTVEQQYMFNLKNIRVLTKDLDSKNWELWWNRFRREITKIALKNER